MLNEKKADNVYWQDSVVTRDMRQDANGHKSAILWFTGLPSAGKTTLSKALEYELHKQGCQTMLLDGDNVRHGLCGDLGFSEKERTENIRRVGEVANLGMQSGLIVITALVSPIRTDRDNVRALVGAGEFIEIFCDCPVDVCEERDVKGLYKKARAGIIPQFTGISADYETPNQPEITLNTVSMTVEQCIQHIIDYMRNSKLIPS